MKVLALETATEACSAALYVDGVIRERFEVAPRAHTRLILPMLDELLQEAGVLRSQVDALAFGRGPGSFTGVRLAAAVAQGIAFGIDVPVVPVSTLAALASAALREGAERWVFAALDARMKEVYWGVYRRSMEGGPALWGEERVLPPESVPFPEKVKAVGVGPGWRAYGDILERRVGSCLAAIDPTPYPRASVIAELGVAGLARGNAVPARQALPVYLRDQVARKPKMPFPQGCGK